MRYLIKGGVWKNSEDEILKAAIMKYGLNQWSRISSLLARKSAKQCKQRWYEWLDPSIKKTEWTREEDEKLLHLAKIFPTQWRTIAPIVGRTPTQCVERYDRLLDQAQGKDINDPNDPRKLKPGEIDPNPESKPARPDPINMDEDEKEMLAEARVRLANTKGKKAKRKLREKMIEEAKRLASLQKKREMRAAGIEPAKKKKRKGIDLLNEIPFERQVPDYVFETGAAETPKPDLDYQAMSYNQIDGKHRREQEQAHREIDAKRKKKLMNDNMEKVADAYNKEQEKLFKNKTQLKLPEAQMKDADLELLGKLNSFQDASEVQQSATKALVGNYSQREVAQTPMRTPSQSNNIMKEAHNLIALQQTQTPLLGGENQVMDDIQKTQGLLPTPSNVPQTPNHLKQSLLGQQASVLGGLSVRQGSSVFGDQSVLRGAGGAMTSMTPSIAQTPRRDEFSINPAQDNWDDQSSMVSGVSGLNEEKLQKLRQAENQRRIKEQIFALPKPKHEYQVEIPEIIEEEEEEKQVEDAEEEIRRKKEEELLEFNKKMRMRSLCIQKSLPRPKKIPNQLYDHIQDKNIPDLRKQATQLIDQEILNLLSFDSQNFPFPGVQPINFQVQLDDFEEVELTKASKLIQKEIQQIREELHHGNIDKDFIQSKWKDASNSIVYSKEQQKVFDLREVNKKQEYQILLEQANNKRDLFIRESKKLEQMEKKVNIMLGGYKKVMQKHLKEVTDIQNENDKHKITKSVYTELKNQEDRSILPRLDELREYYAMMENKQAKLQEKYEALIQEKHELVSDSGYFNNQVNGN